MFNILSSMFVVVGLLTSAFSFAADITWENRKSMFLYGTIDVKDDNGESLGVLEINYLPGAINVYEDGKEYLTKALDSMTDYVKTDEFWRDSVWSTVVDCARYARRVHNDVGMGTIPKGWVRCKERFNSVPISEFGGLGTKCSSMIMFGGQCLLSPLFSAAGAVIAIAGATIVVPMKILWPVGRSTILTTGVAWSTVKMVWNGAAWGMTAIYKKTPKQQDSAIVTWKPHRNR